MTVSLAAAGGAIFLVLGAAYVRSRMMHRRRKIDLDNVAPPTAAWAQERSQQHIKLSASEKLTPKPMVARAARGGIIFDDTYQDIPIEHTAGTATMSSQNNDRRGSFFPEDRKKSGLFPASSAKSDNVRSRESVTTAFLRDGTGEHVIRTYAHERNARDAALRERAEEKYRQRAKKLSRPRPPSKPHRKPTLPSMALGNMGRKPSLGPMRVRQKMTMTTAFKQYGSGQGLFEATAREQAKAREAQRKRARERLQQRRSRGGFSE